MLHLSTPPHLFCPRTCVPCFSPAFVLLPQSAARSSQSMTGLSGGRTAHVCTELTAWRIVEGDGRGVEVGEENDAPIWVSGFLERGGGAVTFGCCTEEGWGGGGL